MTPTPPPAALTPGPAADLLVWALEQVAHVVNHELDPTVTRREASASVAGTPKSDANQLLESFRLAATSLRLRCAPVSLSAHDLVTQHLPFPLVTTKRSDVAPGWLVITERHGFRLHVQDGPGEATWMDEAALAGLLGEQPVTFLHCVPASPLEKLSAASHAAQAIIGGEDGHDPHHAHLPPWQRLWSLLSLERDDIWVVVIYSAVVGVLSLATPVAVQSLVGTVAFGTLLQPIVVLALLFLVALGFQAVLKALQARVIEALQARVFARVALDVAWRLPRTARDGHLTPELVNRFFDVVTVQKTLATVLTDGLAAFMQISIGLVVLAFYHPALLALDLVILLATNLFIFLPLRRGVRTAFDESQAKYEMAAWLEELARAPSAFRSSGGAALATAKADALTRTWLAARRRHFTVIFGQTISALLVHVVASAVLLGFGGYLVLQQSLTLGQLIAAELIVAAVTSSITKFGKVLESSYDLVVGLSKLGHLVDLEANASVTGEAVPGTGPVAVRLHEVVTDGAPLSLVVQAGARVALVGALGTPLAEVLAGVRAPAQGTVELNGVDVRRASSCALHDEIAFVRIDDLFVGTVMENVSLARPGITPAEVRAAVERVGLDEVIRALPKGYDTVLGPHGAPLAPAQAVALVVARALAATPRLVVVDDTLEALDPVSRARVISALTSDRAPWTLVALVNDPDSALARSCAIVTDLAAPAGPGPTSTEAHS